MKHFMLKLTIGFAIGLSIALLVGSEHMGWSATLGVIAVVIGLVMMRAEKRNKLVSCLVASSLIAAPLSVYSEDSFAGYNGQHCYCFELAGQTQHPTTEQHMVSLDFVVQETESGIIPVITKLEHPDPSTLVDFATFNQSLAAWGIDLRNQTTPQYAKNGVPTSADQVPFQFGSARLALYPDRPQVTVVIEESTDMFTWTGVSQFNIPIGTTVQFIDSPGGSQTFYRVRATAVDPQAVGFQPAAGPVLLGCGIGLLVGFGVVAVLAVRACEKNAKKFKEILPPPATNAPPVVTNAPPAIR